MFSFFKKKEEPINYSEQLLGCLENANFNIDNTIFMYLNAVDDIIQNAKTFEEVETRRNELYMKIYDSPFGMDWFISACKAFFTMKKNISNVANEGGYFDAFLGAYWFYYIHDKERISSLINELEHLIPPIVRRYYEKTFNIDIYTGEVFDSELEENNAFKEHFYRASYAYNQGRGDLELSMKEWRYFLMELANTLESRPRVIYDFAKEVCEHQKLFMFVAYALKAEKINMLTQNNQNENKVIESLLTKIANAIYATNEDYGLYLKKYYA